MTYPKASPAAKEYDSLSMLFSISGPGGRPISVNKTSVMCLLAEPWYTRPIPKRPATCNVWGMSSSIEVGGRSASTCIARVFVRHGCAVPLNAADNP